MSTFTNATYTDNTNSMIKAQANGRPVFIPVDPDNTDYEELVEQGIVVAAYIAPELTWLQLIQATDGEMPRWFEDYLDDVGPPASGRVRDNYDAKKTLRGQKPS